METAEVRISCGMIRTSLRRKNWLADTWKRKIRAQQSGKRFSVCPGCHTYGFADVVLHHDRGLVS
jgi:hypothetical protein